MKNKFSKEVIVISAIFLIALAIRIVYILQVRDDPFFYEPHQGTDMLTFHNMALDILKGSGRISFNVPLYPNGFLPIIYFLFGPNIAAVGIIQGLLGSLTCILIYLIGRELFGNISGILAGLISVFYSTLVIYGGVLLGETLGLFLFLAGFYLLLRAVNSASLWDAAFSGIFLGLLLLTRVRFFAFVPFIPLAFLANSKLRCRDKLKSLCILFMVASIFVNPVQSIKDIVINNPVMFFLSNSPTATGGYDERSLGAFDKVNQTSRPEDKDTPGYYKGLYRESLNFMKQNPIGYAGLLIRKCIFFWDPAEKMYDNFPARYYRNTVPILSLAFLSFGIVFPFGLWGMVMAKGEWRRVLLLYLFVISYFLMHLGFNVVARYRLPVEPVFIIFAGHCITLLYDKFKKGDFRFVRINSGLILIAGILFNWTSIHRTIYPKVHPHGIYMYKGDRAIIRDDTGGLPNTRYTTLLSSANERILKKLFIGEEISRIRSARHMIDCIASEDMDILVSINGNAVHIKSAFNTVQKFPYGGTLQIPVPLSYLVKGENEIIIRGEDAKRLFVVIDDYYDYNRSAFSGNNETWNYRDLGSWSILADGEFRIGLELFF
ncbi:MAG: glycosyltransferase family 39 protein [Candidatus Omnitrophica bacterium]|nr:glycosyltransferase family 39 protein [Candidatus Omnitrophota bacterium]